MLKIPHRPSPRWSVVIDPFPHYILLLTIPGFSMPTLNSICPFLEAVCPKSDLCWHIHRGRLLSYYESVWAVFRDDETTFDCEPQLGKIEAMKDSRFMLCLIPNSWMVSLKTKSDFAGLCKLRKFCSHLVSAKTPRVIWNEANFLREVESRETEEEMIKGK